MRCGNECVVYVRVGHLTVRVDNVDGVLVGDAAFTDGGLRAMECGCVVGTGDESVGRNVRSTDDGLLIGIMVGANDDNAVGPGDDTALGISDETADGVKNGDREGAICGNMAVGKMIRDVSARQIEFCLDDRGGDGLNAWEGLLMVPQ